MKADIVERLRAWVHTVKAVPASDIMDEAAAEIERLRGDAEIDRLCRSAAHAEAELFRKSFLRLAEQDARETVSQTTGPAPAADGTSWPTSGAGPVLTAWEREAIVMAASVCDASPNIITRNNAAMLCSLLERTK
jgi:hypothetical protein